MLACMHIYTQEDHEESFFCMRTLHMHGTEQQGPMLACLHTHTYTCTYTHVHGTDNGDPCVHACTSMQNTEQLTMLA